MKIHFGLRGWQAWGPDSSFGALQSLPANLRRRITPLGQYALQAAWGLPDIKKARYILSSRHGEFSRTLSLLEAAARKEELSPADFTLSVHHALVGLLSIAQKNPLGHTALGAGKDSFMMGLVEASACVQAHPAEPVILIHFDDLLPEPFADFGEQGERPMALALALGTQDEGAPIHIEARASSAQRSLVPQAQSFLDFLTSGATEGASISGEREWRWSKA